jgi:hypothetical protein
LEISASAAFSESLNSHTAETEKGPFHGGLGDFLTHAASSGSADTSGGAKEQSSAPHSSSAAEYVQAKSYPWFG